MICSERFSRIIYVLIILCASIFSKSITAKTLGNIIEADITSHSFSLIYYDKDPVKIRVELFDDVYGLKKIDKLDVKVGFSISNSTELENKLSEQGIVSIQISNLESNKKYFYKILIEDANNPQNTWVIPNKEVLPSVKTFDKATPVNNPTVAISLNHDDESKYGIVLVRNEDGSFVTGLSGDNSPEGIALINLNNLYDLSKRTNRQLKENEMLIMKSLAGKEGNNDSDFKLINWSEKDEIGELYKFKSAIELSDWVDTDKDGMPDHFEKLYGLNPNINDAKKDFDNDGVNNKDEYIYGLNPKEKDSDKDGLDDKQEISIGTLASENDTDGDGISDGDEQLIYYTDPLNVDTDGDSVNDGVEIDFGTDPKDINKRPLFDDDGDGIENDVDNCPKQVNPDQENHDDDENGDACDMDDDNDGVADSYDNAPFTPNIDQVDSDNDGIGDVIDNCPNNINPLQENNDGDEYGDICDPDDDNDGVNDFKPIKSANEFARIIVNIKSINKVSLPIINSQRAFIYFIKYIPASKKSVILGSYNLMTREYEKKELILEEKSVEGILAIQADAYICNCINFEEESEIELETSTAEKLKLKIPPYKKLPANGGLLFISKDGSSFENYKLNSTPQKLSRLIQNGNSPENLDNCRFIPNPEQEDIDGDGIGLLCDKTKDDIDGDGVKNNFDNCPETHNEDQNNIDGDSFGDACDDDIDDDGLKNHQEEQIGSNPYAADTNDNGINDSDEDFDLDGVPNLQEIKENRNPHALEVQLKTGKQLIHYPLTNSSTSYELLSLLGGSEYIEKIEQTADNEEDKKVAFYDVDNNKNGNNFTINSGSAFIVTVKKQRIHRWESNIACVNSELKIGVNLLGFGCVKESISAFKLLELLGGSDVVSMIRYFNSEAQRFVFAGYDEGVLVGDDFNINKVDGYIINLKQQIKSLPNEILNNNKTNFSVNFDDNQVVSTDEPLLKGLVKDDDAFITINGIVANKVLIPGGVEFYTKLKGLKEGDNEIIVKILDSGNQIYQRHLKIKYAIPPQINITSHYDGMELNSKWTTLHGSVDIQDTVVKINDKPITINNGVFSKLVELKEGSNRIRVTGKSPKGGFVKHDIFINVKPVYVTIYSGRKRVVDFDLPLDNNVINEMSSWKTRSSIVDEITVGKTNITKFLNKGRIKISFGLTLKDKKYTGVSDGFVKLNFVNKDNDNLHEESIWLKLAVVDKKPILDIDPKYFGKIYDSENFLLSGRVFGSVGKLKVNDEDIDLIYANGNNYFSKDVKLTPGRNYIDLTVLNNTVEDVKELVVYRKTNSPVNVDIISHKNKQVVSDDKVSLSGKVSHPNSKIFINGEKIDVVQGEDGLGYFNYKSELNDGNNDFKITTNYSGLVGGNTFRIIKAPFVISIDSFNELDEVRYEKLTILGSSSSKLEEIYVNGKKINVIDNNFNGYLTLEEGDNQLSFTAKESSGKELLFFKNVIFKPYKFTIPKVGVANVDLFVEVPDEIIPKIKSWDYKKSNKLTPAGAFRYPFMGKVKLSNKIDKVGYGKIRLKYLVENSGRKIARRFSSKYIASGLAPGFYKDNIDIDFVNGKGEILYSKNISATWDVKNIDKKTEIFIDSISDNQKVFKRTINMFGFVYGANIEQVLVNGQKAKIYGNDFSIHNVQLNYATNNTIIIEVSDKDGSKYLKKINVIHEPKIIAFKPGETKKFDFQLYGYSGFGKGAKLIDADLDTRYSELVSVLNDEYDFEANNPYMLYKHVIASFELKYSKLADAGLWRPGNTRLISSNGHYVLFSSATHEEKYDLFYQLDPEGEIIPDIRLISHKNDQVVYRETEDLAIGIENDGLAQIWVNGTLARRTYLDRNKNINDSGKFILEHHAAVNLKNGANIISVRAVSHTGHESTKEFKLNKMPWVKPKIHLSGGIDGIEIYRSSENELFTIRGKIDSSIPVDTILVNGIKASIKKNNNSLVFEAKIELLGGVNKIEIVANNPGGKTTLTPSIIVLEKAPDLKVELEDNVNNGDSIRTETVRFNVNQGDKNAKLDIFVNNKVFKENIQYESSFNVPLLEAGKNTITFKSTNYTGSTERSFVFDVPENSRVPLSINLGETKFIDIPLPISMDQLSNVVQIDNGYSSNHNFNVSNDDKLIAKNGKVYHRVKIRSGWETEIEQHIIPLIIKLFNKNDELLLEYPVVLKANVTDEPIIPEFTISHESGHIVRNDHVTLFVQTLNDANPVVTINNEETTVINGPNHSSMRLDRRFVRRISLHDGENKILISVTSHTGNTVNKTVLLIRDQAVEPILKQLFDDQGFVIYTNDSGEKQVDIVRYKKYENHDKFHLNGVFDGNIQVDSLMINETSLNVEHFDNDHYSNESLVDYKFDYDLPVIKGINKFTIKAKNSNAESSFNLIVKFLEEKPALTIDNINDGQLLSDLSLNVSGTVSDISAQVRVNGVDAKVNASGHYTALIKLDPGSNTITVEADNYSGRTSLERNVIVSLEEQTKFDLRLAAGSKGTAWMTFYEPKAVLEQLRQVSPRVNWPSYDFSNLSMSMERLNANALKIGITLELKASALSGTQEIPVTLTFTDSEGNTLFTRDVVINVVIPVPEESPKITLSNIVNEQVINGLEYTIRGEISDPNATVTVNGVTATVEERQFKVTVPLTLGNNVIKIIATNQYGSTEIEVRVTAKEADDNGGSGSTNDRVSVEVPINSTAKTSLTIKHPLLSQMAFYSYRVSKSPNFISGFSADNAMIRNGVLTLDMSFNTRANALPGTYEVPVIIDIKGSSGNVLFSHEVTFNIIIPELSVIDEAPVLKLSNLEEGQIIKGLRFTVLGTVSDPKAEVVVNGVKAQIQGIGFSVPIELKEGNNSIQIKATNDYGSDTKVINVIAQKPSIPVIEMSVTNGQGSGALKLDIDGELLRQVANFTLNFDGNSPVFISRWSVQNLYLLANGIEGDLFINIPQNTEAGTYMIPFKFILKNGSGENLVVKELLISLQVN
ncbi:thrombospondin type 3 repeat-containing protein [Zooshikella sp. RANM57]|uniref:thrombospondin type 3 repeat-containing protein n=1 Tax=Zooshikella sp. RANM57 TaxID=3425863 RepID=UPI003D6F6084